MCSAWDQFVRYLVLIGNLQNVVQCRLIIIYYFYEASIVDFDQMFL